MSDFSSMEDSDEGAKPAAKKRKKTSKGGSASTSASSVAAKSSSPAATSAEKERDKVKRLKSYIFLAGVRKPYKKLFGDANCPDPLSSASPKEEVETFRQQAKILQDILQDELGIEGRPTKEKCKASKEKREWEKEMEEIQRAGKTERARTRGEAMGKREATRNRTESEDERSEQDEDEKLASKPKVSPSPIDLISFWQVDNTKTNPQFPPEVQSLPR